MPRPLRLVRDLRVFLGNSPLACRGSTANALERVGSLTPVNLHAVVHRESLKASKVLPSSKQRSTWHWLCAMPAMIPVRLSVLLLLVAA